MKYSFLIPAYNVEKYLKKCITSILNQKYKKSNYEIVIVNDGSIDKTSKIITNFQKIYKNIKLVSQNNKGLPETRQTLINNAQGEWIIFVDADDYLSPNFLDILDPHISHDYNFYIIKEIKDQLAKKIDSTIQKNKMDDSIASRVIHKSLFNKYKFPKNRYAIEDWDFYVHKYNKFKIKNLTNINNLWYHYRFNEKSLSKDNKYVYKSRLTHALDIFENPNTRNSNLSNKIIGHKYSHLYMMAKLWFPDLLPRVKKIKYKTKEGFIIRLQKTIVMLGLFNYFIKKTKVPIYD